MKTKIFYSNWFAKLILSCCHTIMLLGMIFTKKKKPKTEQDIGVFFLSQSEKTHELIHVAQYRECFVVGCVLMFLFVLLWGFSVWYILLPMLMYYVLYLVEWAVAFVHHIFSKRKKDFVRANGKAYKNSAMEMEAYENEKNPEYLNKRAWYSFVKYYGKL